jgi:glutaredoxin
MTPKSLSSKAPMSVNHRVIVMKKATVTIYTRPGCHLCGEAKAAIYASGCNGEFALEEINIDEDPALGKRYGYDIPVIFINGVKVFKHSVDPQEFKRKLRRLAGRRPAASSRPAETVAVSAADEKKQD